MSQRLEDIKEWFNADEELHEFQIEWLIEQAEKVEELEKEIEEHCETKGLLGRQVFALTKRVDELIEENNNLKQYKNVLMENSVVRSKTIEKYEKALKDIIKLGHIGAKYESLEAQIAKEALEGE